jgi:plastocyanin
MRKFIVSAAVVWLAACGGNQQVETKQAETKEAKAPAPAYFQVNPATAGAINGKVVFAGRKPTRKTINVKSEEPECAPAGTAPLMSEDTVVNANGTLANVFVYVSAGLEGKTFAPPEGPAKFDQKGCSFRPHVIGVRTGQPFVVTNSDPVTHNVHPTPANNREWNQGQRPGTESIERTFDKPEIGIPIKCNVHSWMNAFACVVDHPFFAVTGDDGSFSLKGLPPGEYTVTAWHEKLGMKEQKVTVAASSANTLDFTINAK